MNASNSSELNQNLKWICDLLMFTRLPSAMKIVIHYDSFMTRYWMLRYAKLLVISFKIHQYICVCVCICGYMYMAVYMCIYAATTIICSNQKCIHFLGSQLVLSKTGHTSEGSIIHVSTIFSTKALLIFIVEFINWFLFVLPEAYKYYNRF